ncbi:MAG: alpha/beta hydrolase family protein [Pyrinomonadaceae bacterium]
MRVLIATLMLVVTATALSAQALEPDFVYGRDYTFERMAATRAVHDAEDKGTIRLVAYVYRPIKNDRHEVVLFSHGSTGGMIRSPQEPGGTPPPSVIRFFISRGYTLVAPTRRGRGESSGTYVEECAYYLGQCTLAEQAALTDRGLREAILDSNAVIDQLILGRLVSRQAKILLGGISRGGFLSLMIAGERPALVKGVINFVGGWLSVSDKYPPADNKLRLDAQTVLLKRAGKRATSPTVWIYAARDPYYAEATSRGEFFRTWREAGGQGEYFYVTEHSLPIGHDVATNAALWESTVDDFLKRIDPVRH